MSQSNNNKKLLFTKIYNYLLNSMSKGHGFGKNPVIRKIQNSIQNKLKSDFAVIQGSKMYLDPEDKFNLSLNGVYGEYETELMKKYIKKGDIVIDVGANIGYFTLIYSQLVGKYGKVYAFEPEPKNFAILKKNVEINKYENIILEEKAVSDTNEKIKLYVSDHMANHKIYQVDSSAKNFLEINAINLNDYLENLGIDKKINFIKIDVEGAEFHVFNGIKSLLSKNPNLKIFTEFMYGMIKSCGNEPKDIVEILHKNKFKINYVDSINNTISPANISKLTTPKNYLGTVNLFCFK
jgi:FkbM family methyltransferase